MCVCVCVCVCVCWGLGGNIIQPISTGKPKKKQTKAQPSDFFIVACMYLFFLASFFKCITKWQMEIFVFTAAVSLLWAKLCEASVTHGWHLRAGWWRGLKVRGFPCFQQPS